MAQADRTRPGSGPAAGSAGPGGTGPAGVGADGTSGTDGLSDQSGLDQAFDQGGLTALRSAVAAHGSELGLAGDRLEMLVVVAHELATNAVRHGGGTGRLRLWRADGSVFCRVSDGGPGLPHPDPEDWTARPPAHVEGGRGLYFVRMLADQLRVDSTDAGAAVTAEFVVP